MSGELVADDFVRILAASPMCVLIHDAVTKEIVWANPAACAALGFSLEEIKPLKAPDMSSPDQMYSRANGHAWLQGAVDEGRSSTVWRYRSKSGREFPADALAVRVELHRGPAVLVQFRDIEREQTIERSLHRTEEFFHALARHTSAGAVVLTEAGAVEYASPTALIQFRTDRAEFFGAELGRFAEITDAAGRPGWPAAAAAARPVSPVKLEVRGVPVWLGGSLDRLSVDGEDFLLLTVHDITDRVVNDIAEGRRAEYENHLSRYNAMGDMAMAIAHELGQPLAAASNYLVGARLRNPRGNDLEALEGALRQLDRAAKIVKALREFVGHLEQVATLVDLNDVVADCMYFIRLRATDAGVRVHESWATDPVPVRCERVLTGQVVMNLCFNAIDAVAGGPIEHREIRVSTALAGGGRFTVEDRGHGLAVPSVFDQPFTSKEHGSGLGLALSHRIITRQHGVLAAGPVSPHGAVFSFTLPLAGKETLSGRGENQDFPAPGQALASNT